MIWRISLTFVVLISAISVIRGLTTNCHSECRSCALYNDRTACTSCNNGTLALLNNDYGYCTNRTCSELGGLLSVENSTGITKCFLGGYCPNGYYATTANRCEKCDSSCGDCFGANATHCLTCSAGKVLNVSSESAYGGNCIEPTACNDTLIGQPAAVCGKNGTCDTSCQTCVGPLADHCTACKDTTKMLSIQNNAGTVGWGLCTDTVALSRKYYSFGYNPSSIVGQFKCHWTCQGCVAENDRFACTGCAANAYLNVISEVNGAPVGNCKPTCESPNEKALIIGNKKLCSGNGTCPLNYTGMINYSGGVCSRNGTCDSTCGLCNGTTASDCTFCPNWGDWLKLKAADATSGTCGGFATGSNFTAYGKLYLHATECTAPFTKADGLMCKIETCNVANCITCGSSANLCWKCASGYLLRTDNVEGICVQSCASGYVATADNKMCVKCHSDCTSCAEGIAFDQCKTCAGGKILATDAPSSCLTSCPAGLYNNGGVCRASTPSSGGSDEESGTPGWYVGAIIIGIVSMLAFFGFVGYMILEWRKEGAGSAESKPEIKQEPKLAAPVMEPKKEDKKVG